MFSLRITETSDPLVPARLLNDFSVLASKLEFLDFGNFLEDDDDVLLLNFPNMKTRFRPLAPIIIFRRLFYDNKSE